MSVEHILAMCAVLTSVGIITLDFDAMFIVKCVRLQFENYLKVAKCQFGALTLYLKSLSVR